MRDEGREGGVVIRDILVLNVTICEEKTTHYIISLEQVLLVLHHSFGVHIRQNK